MDPCGLTKSFYDEARESWLCAGCGNPREERAIDVQVEAEPPVNIPLNFAQGSTVGIANKDFLFSLGKEHVIGHLHLGGVLGPNGDLLEDWFSFVGRHRLIVRGSEHAQARVCTVCGKNVYFAVGQRYLYPHPPLGVRIFDAGTGSLVITKELMDCVDLQKWKHLKCIGLEVLESPRDGYLDLRGI